MAKIALETWRHKLTTQIQHKPNPSFNEKETKKL